MPTATVPSLNRPPPAAIGPAGAAPPGWVWAVMFRRRRGDPWRELFRGATAQEAWSLMCESKTSGQFRPVLRRADLFDQPGEDTD